MLASRYVLANWIALLKARLPFELENEEGQGMAEYGLILALIAIAVVLALTTLAGGLNTIFGDVNAELTNAGG
ncbi:MAG TPA: Flp family type IVb pilin [Caldilineaceae bacterium]|nr:Flp family type IVb pilin [Caldilineaceae bacterium]